jgi:hypothetical protein
MTVAALRTLGAATRSGDIVGNRAVALRLADDLMSEILALPYSDPNDTPSFGPEGIESAGPRTAFDDVDDYDGWDQQPPQFRDGTTIPERDNWRRQVTIQYVRTDNPDLGTAGNSDAGVKRIHVTIEYLGQVLAEQYALATDVPDSEL